MAWSAPSPCRSRLKPPASRSSTMCSNALSEARRRERCFLSEGGGVFCGRHHLGGDVRGPVAERPELVVALDDRNLARLVQLVDQRHEFGPGRRRHKAVLFEDRLVVPNRVGHIERDGDHVRLAVHHRARPLGPDRRHEGVAPSVRGQRLGEIHGVAGSHVALHRETRPLEVDVRHVLPLQLRDQRGVGIDVVVERDLLDLDVWIGRLEGGHDGVHHLFLRAAGRRMRDAQFGLLRQRS